MVEINLESMVDVQAKTEMGKRVYEFTNVTGEVIRLVTTIEKGAWVHDASEKVDVDEPYRYENMQKEMDRLQQEIEDLKEFINNMGYQEAG